MTDNENTNSTESSADAAAPNKKLGLIVGGALVVLIGGFAGVSMLCGDEQPIETTPVAVTPEPVQAAQPEPEPEPEPEPVMEEPEPEPEPVQPEPEPEPAPPKVVLPALDDSDGSLMGELTQMSWHKDFTALFINKDIIRRFVVFTDNMASGTIARDYASFKPPIGRFKVIETEQEILLDEESYKRYDIYMAVISSADPKEMVGLYSKYKPLIKEVYDEIGYPDHDFTDTLIQAIDHVLDTPIVDGRIELVSPKVMYDFKNEDWQSLTHVQKQVMRLGPENISKLKPLLRRYRALLANL